jgi:drug/metabolite transporter (DMT)-like permease
MNEPHRSTQQEAHRLVVYGALGVLIAVWGSTWAVIRIGLEAVPPFSGASARFLVAGGMLLVLRRALRVPKQSGARLRRLWWIEGVFSFGIAYGVVYWAEQWVSSGLAAVLFSTFPLFVAIFAHLWLGDERLRFVHLVGIALGTVGVALISGDDFALGSRRELIAALVMLLSPVAAAVAHVQVKKWGRGLHPLNLVAVPMLGGGAALGLIALAVERTRPFELGAVAVGSVLYLALMGSALTFTVYYWLLERLPATRLALITYGIPVVAVLIGTFGLGEPITLRILIGATFVLVGVAVALGR